jgi:hypothetical protein
MIQVLATFNEFQSYNYDGVSHFESDIDAANESMSIVMLLNHVQTSIRSVTKPLQYDDQLGKRVLSFVSQAILPYARTLVLLLRASMSAVRLKGTVSSEELDKFLENEDTMMIEDGFFFMQHLDCPMPSEIIIAFDDDSGDSVSMYWRHLIDRWIAATVTLDVYQGSHGDHLEYNEDTKTWSPRITKRDHNVNSPLPKESAVSDVLEDQEAVEFEDTPMEISNSSLNDVDAADEGNNVMDDEEDDFDNAAVIDPLAFIDGGLDVMDDAESSDEEMEFVEFQTFDDEIDDISGLPSLPTQSTDMLQTANDESEQSTYSWDENERVSQTESSILKDLDNRYANVSTSAIVPFQPSLLGLKEPGPGPRGVSLDYKYASNICRDVSHLGLIHCPPCKLYFIYCFFFTWMMFCF